MTAPVISAHMAVCHTLRTLLLAAPPLAEGNVVANRRRPMAAVVDRQVFIYLEQSQSTRGDIRGAPFDWRTGIRIECLARDTGPADADAIADALLVQVYARIMADTTLAGTVLDIDPRALGYTGDEADNSLSSAQILLTVWHVTADNSIATA